MSFKNIKTVKIQSNGKLQIETEDGIVLKDCWINGIDIPPTLPVVLPQNIVYRTVTLEFGYPPVKKEES